MIEFKIQYHDGKSATDVHAEVPEGHLLSISGLITLLKGSPSLIPHIVIFPIMDYMIGSVLGMSSFRSSKQYR